MFVLNVSDKSEGLIIWSVNSYYSPVMTCLTVQCPSARQGFRWSDQIRGDGEFACQTNDDNCIETPGHRDLVVVGGECWQTESVFLTGPTVRR